MQVAPKFEKADRAEWEWK